MSDAFVDLVTRSFDYLSGRQDRLKAEYDLEAQDRWYWDEPARTIEFSLNDEPTIAATTRVVGSVSTISGTWLWSWANENLDPAHWRDLLEVRRLGERLGIWQLTTPKWEADETDGWEMTSIAANVLQVEGAYRIPYPGTFYYLLLTDVRRLPVK